MLWLKRSAALALMAALVTWSPAWADNEAGSKIRVLLVTDSGGFIHDSVGVAEEVMNEIGPKNGMEVTTYRFTRDPNQVVKIKEKGSDTVVEKRLLDKYSADFRARTGLTVEPENCGRINKETLKNFDVVLFFTTGNPVNKEELQDLQEWVRNGGGFAGTHCATDTLYNTTYGELIGAYFQNHPWHQKVRLNVESPDHPGAAGFKDGDEITDEIYQFHNEPYSRDKLHIILSIDNDSIDTQKQGVAREDKDFAVAWVRDYGKGKVFYTSLGHRKEVWRDKRFQDHLIGGIKWAAGVVPGDSTPSAKLTK